MAGVKVEVDGADALAEHALERDRRRLDHGDVEAELARRGGDLAADPAGARDHDRGARAQPFAQRIAVGHAAQVEHAVEVAPRNRQPPRAGAGGEQQLVVAQQLAVAERHRLRRRIQAGDRGGGAQLDVVAIVEAGAVDVEPVATGLATQIVL